MRIKLNSCRVHVLNMHDALKRTNGFCPCVLNPAPEDMCMCDDFMKKIKDPDFEGYCHCKLFYKEK